MVMASGIQISRPVMKYFFTVLEMKRPGLRRAGSQSRPGSVGHGRRGRFLGFRFRFGLRLGVGFGLRFSLGFALRIRLEIGLLLRRLLGRGLEVGRVPAAAL